MAQDSVILNGQAISSKNLTVTMLGSSDWLIAEAEYSDSLKPEKVKNANAVQSDQRTLGEYEPTASISMYEREFTRFLDRLSSFAQQSGLGYKEYEFNIVIEKNSLGQGPRAKVEIFSARVTETSQSVGNDANALMWKINLDVMSIVVNNHLAFTGQKRE